MFWEYNLINFLVCVFDTYLIYDFVGYYEGVSPRLLTKKSRITVILLTSCITFFINLFNNTALNLFATLFINFLFIYLVMNGNLFQKCIHYLIIIAFQYGGEFLTAIVIANRMGEAVLAYQNVKAYAVLIVKMINFIQYLLVKQLVPKRDDSIDKEAFFIFMIIPVSSIGLMFSVTYLNIDFSDTPVKRGVLLLFYLMLLLGNVLVAYAFRRYAAINKNLQAQKKLIEDYRVQLGYYRQVEVVNKKNAAFHHDMCHYLKAIGNLAEDNRNSQIISLLDELQIEFFKVDNQDFCSNPVLNTILNEEIKEARRQRVDCQVYVEPGFSIGSIRETDLISALGNLYQNALEAAAKSRNGFIKTTMFMENEGRFLVISMENSYEGAILRDGEKFLTTKENKFIHGIGIERVREIAKRYGGSLRTNYKEGIFRAILVLSS